MVADRGCSLAGLTVAWVYYGLLKIGLSRYPYVKFLYMIFYNISIDRLLVFSYIYLCKKEEVTMYKTIKNFVNTIPGCFCYTALMGWCFFGNENDSFESFFFGSFFFWGLLNLLVLCLDYIKNKG